MTCATGAAARGCARKRAAISARRIRAISRCSASALEPSRSISGRPPA